MLTLRQVAWVLISLIIVLGAWSANAHAKALVIAQNAQTDEVAEGIAKAAERREEAKDAVETLSRLIENARELNTEIKALKRRLKNAAEEATKAEISAQLKSQNARLSELEQQITALSTGVSDEEYRAGEDESFDLQKELEGLAEPFVQMMKSATEDARRIEGLRGSIAVAKRRQEIAKRAIERLRFLEANSAKDAKTARKHLNDQVELWEKRLEEAINLMETSEQQLKLRLDEEASGPGETGSFLAEFMRSRGLNLILGLLAFTAVFLFMRLISRLLGIIKRYRNIPRNFYTRLATLIHRVLTFVLAVFAMVAVFNYMNDWMLMGVTGVFMLALAWIGLKMLPNIIEQTTLLLNLGAVQEGERVMMNGIPWQVEQLNFYTDLVNPVLSGGTFTLPIRELSGLHSRPAARDEAWFPTKKDDWIVLADGRLAKVVIQTPELVQLVELGGARITFTAQDFIAAAPRNLSPGFRVEVQFGIDYQHQAEATGEIIDKMAAYVEAGLLKIVDRRALRNVEVTLVRAGDNSIDYEVEADLSGSAAHQHDDVQHEMTRLLIEACNTYGWVIPYPQLVVRRA